MRIGGEPRSEATIKNVLDDDILKMGRFNV